MNTKQILNALRLTSNSTFNAYCSKLSNICNLVAELQTLEGYNYTLGPVLGNLQYVQAMPVLVEPAEKKNAFGGHTPAYSRYLERVNAQNVAKWVSGNFLELQQIAVGHKSGNYTFYIPTCNDFYTYFLSLLAATKIAREQAAPLAKVEFEATATAEILPAIKKALHFVSGDVLRPAMCGVCFHFKGDRLHIVATDAHALYRSTGYPVDDATGGEHYFILPLAAAKELVKIKTGSTLHFTTDGKECRVTITASGDTYGYNLITEKYPPYENVIPQYIESMTFDRAALTEKIKVVLPAANQITKQVNLHLNGSITVTGCDVDMSYESTANMDYESKNLPDMDIAFNGILLLNVLKHIDGKKCNMYSAGNRNRAAIFTGEKTKDVVLLMPLQIG